ncbi:unnamed protein product [Kluyveromyces dobzhanskii CBS 2104]|uniref:WGS project CCBQ000000000 data, contig 00099 n=1 Tax=Kluyveromyces dobzhanskii CBS 2104 TaxID=1427455 RepID=A0A0A8L4Q9_9SACH|nr:unnamed protein product [Kluyveromyces dobzhanskii CBS 2104]
MKFSKITPFLFAPLAAAQFFNGSTTTLEPSSSLTEQQASTYYSTITNEIVQTVYLTLDNNEVSTQLSTLTTDEVSALLTTLQPATVTTNSDGSTVTVTGELTSTTTVTILSTVVLDDATTIAAVNAGVDQIYADDVTSTLTSTLVQTLTLTNSAGQPTATTVSAAEKQVLLGDFSCVPETVTVTQYEATKYVTVDSSVTTEAAAAGSDANASAISITTNPSTAPYGNSTTYSL